MPDRFGEAGQGVTIVERAVCIWWQVPEAPKFLWPKIAPSVEQKYVPCLQIWDKFRLTASSSLIPSLIWPRKQQTYHNLECNTFTICVCWQLAGQDVLY